MFRVSRTAIELFGVSIHWYGVLIAAGIALGVWLAAAREKRCGLPKDTTLDLALVCVPAAIVGARLYYVIFSWEAYAGGPWWEIFAVWQGGMAIYGGVLGGLLAGAVFARVRRLSFWTLADLAAPCIALGQAIGRWGNFVNQEAHGGPVANPALRFFPMAVEISGEWYYATFFYESVWCFLIVAALLLAERRGGVRRGDLFRGYVFLYALERGVVEGLRTDSLMIGPWRVSQLLSLLAACCVAAYWSRRSARAPLLLRVLAVAGAFAALAAAGSVPSVLLLAAMTLVANAAMLHIHNKNEQMENRGEEV